MNSIIIHGRLTRDPELKKIDTKRGETDVCNFTVAVARRFGEGTDFFDCNIFGKRAEVIKTFYKKGSEIVVRGEMQRQKWKTDAGENRYAWKCFVDDFDFCGSRKDADKPAAPADDGVPEGFEPIDDEDIPF